MTDYGVAEEGGIEHKGKRLMDTDNSVVIGGGSIRGLNGNGKNTIQNNMYFINQWNLDPN